MRDDVLLYYERELTYLREMGAQFAGKYPKIAGRLMLEESKESEDPHVERLLEAFAFLAGRVHLKLDDDFPEITEAFLGIVYPHFIRPIPSMSIVEFSLDMERGKLTTGLKIDRGTVLYSRPVGGVPCKFRTCYDTTLWPVTVTAAAWTTPDQLRPPLRDRLACGQLRAGLERGQVVGPARQPLPGEAGVEPVAVAARQPLALLPGLALPPGRAGHALRRRREPRRGRRSPGQQVARGAPWWLVSPRHRAGRRAPPWYRCGAVTANRCDCGAPAATAGPPRPSPGAALPRGRPDHSPPRPGLDALSVGIEALHYIV